MPTIKLNKENEENEETEETEEIKVEFELICDVCGADLGPDSRIVYGGRYEIPRVFVPTCSRCTALAQVELEKRLEDEFERGETAGYEEGCSESYNEGYEDGVDSAK